MKHLSLKTLPVEQTRTEDFCQEPLAAPSSPESAPREKMPPLQKAALILVIVIGATVIAYFGRPVVLPVLFAWLCSLMLKPLVNWLSMRHIPAPLAAGIVVGGFLVAVGYGALFFGRPAVEWIKSAPETLPQLRQKFEPLIKPALHLKAAASMAGNLQTAEEATKKAVAVEVKDTRVDTTMFTWTGGLLAVVGETIGLLFLLLAFGDIFTTLLAGLMPGVHDKKQISELGRLIQQAISRYLYSVGLVNLGLGVAV
ncbi:MAG: AI-2E family transporter, partial [Gloeobacteraceae cyanobacterium ES-bin-144]|nr:AI-2E family transporter [Verrucomicrobiales bacterium]